MAGFIEMANNSLQMSMHTSMSSTPPPTAQRVPHTRVRLGRSKNVIYSTYNHVVELYGPQMPVLVAESLHYSPNAKQTASVSLNTDCGWAWYVWGRKLLAWHIPSYKDSAVSVMAKEMPLPASDLAHNANLVSIFTQNNQAAPSCIAVSPEGLVRYWEMVGHHSSWVDVNANLGGEEVWSVHWIPPIGCLAVTTSATMVIISPRVVRGQSTVSIQHVSQAPGWFGGIGRRVSSIIFFNSTQSQETRTVKVLTSVRVEGFWHVLLLSGFTLQSWSIEVEGILCSKLYETDLEPIIRQAFPPEVSSNPEIELNITDIRASQEGSVIALVVSSEPRHYIIVELNGSDVEKPDSGVRLCKLSQSNVSVLEGAEGKICSSLQFLLLPTEALVFNNFIIFAVPLRGGEETDGEPLDLPGGVILGGLMHHTSPIFFSATYGFLSVTPVDTACIDVLNTSVVESRATPEAILAREPIASSTPEFVSQLKVAFTHYIRKNLHGCEEVLRREFPLEENSPSRVDSVFATTLIKLSLDIINDLSPKDHRWGEVKEGPKLSGTMSLHLDTQLAEKRQAHDVFLQFVRDISSIIDLGRVTRRGSTVRTIHVLYEHNEKIIAATLMRKLYKKYPQMVGQAISEAATLMGYVYTPGISPTDFFFRYVSIVDEGMKAVISKCVKNSFHNLGSSKFTKLVLVTNDVIIEMLTGILRIRSKKGYLIDRSFVPWLSAGDPNGISDHLSALGNVSYEILSRFGKQTRNSKKLINQFFKLCNILLLLRMNHCELSEFNAMSSAFIQFFLDLKFHSLALQLAYKYKNFEYLVKLSYMTQQESQIQNYIQVFGDDEFCYYLFKWLYLEGRYSELLGLELPSVKYQGQLEEFLKGLPSLEWLYKLKQEDYLSANRILLQLAEAHQQTDTPVTLPEQEIIYSLAKLTALTGSVSPDLSRINSNIEVIQAQKGLSVDLLTRRGYDPQSMSLLSPAQLIELYTCEDNLEESEVHFLKALELLKFIDDSDQHEALRKMIWTRAIGRNDWESTKHDFTPEIVDEFLFFRLLKLVKASENLEVLLPSAEDFLEDPDMKVFSRQDSLSTYLLTYGFEMILGSQEAEIQDDLDDLSS